MELRKRILIVGAGITGLSLAYWLRNKNHTITIAEAGTEAGGVANTLTKDGFELDLGPVTFSLNPALEQLIGELHLTNKLLALPPSKRYLYSNGKIHAVEPSLPKLLFHSMLSWRGRVALLKDLFQKPRANATDETVSSFATRHFGKEAAEKLFDPVLGGIYAGNYNELSIRSVLPLLSDLEATHGSVIKGLIKNQKQFSQKRKIVSIEGGMKTIIEALVASSGAEVKFNCTATSLLKEPNGYRVTLQDQGKQNPVFFDKVFITSPAYSAAMLIKDIDPALSDSLKSIPHSSLQQIYCALDTAPSFDGFGFLVPSRERLSLLGAIHTSFLFPGKSPKGKSLFTLFCGGRRAYPFEANAEQCLAEFNKILGVTARIVHIQKWDNAIPQPTVGHSEILARVESFEKLHPSLHILGSFRGGVAVGDRVKIAREMADAC